MPDYIELDCDASDSVETDLAVTDSADSETDWVVT